MSFLNNLEWRHATKIFDTEKKVSDSDFEKIKEAIQMTPTSFGLEPFHVKIVTDQAVKDKIQPVSWDQPQVGSCSHLLVFCARTDWESRINDYFEMASGGKAEIKEKMNPYEQMMRGALKDRTEHQILDWARNQAYIAHGFALAACAELKIDSCPMEGFDNEAVNKILGLPNHMKSVVMMPIGYRTEDPHHGKVRYPESDLFS
ncbi:NAD(P)H-dependent oxidoreductase [bacterium]|nr:NAD(P)H-dependent oxidoreductase [bacterium]NCQ54986.1 NAD(P)H-dependent oxidoreductase [Candidatus Parcubacteria bacterium]NCS67030.1 NAD(P)H-dependent oxidoreductase [Candidatus Peregrinibacteria bacterium]NCS95976.1 NAD(P)H-dependent oxidoreductase [bacterium]